LNGGKERLAVFGVSCGDPAPSFEHQERVFDKVTELVEVSVVRSLDGTVFLRRNDRIHTLDRSLLKNGYF